MEPRLKTGPNLSKTIHLPSKELRRHATPCYAMLRRALPCSAVVFYAVLYAILRHATPCSTMLGSLPCSTSDCTSKEEIYAMVRDGREG